MSFKFPSILKGCVLHAPLDQESYNPATRRFTDKSAVGNHGISANPANFTTDYMGQTTRAMTFNGAGDYVECGDLGFPDNSFTVAAWWNQSVFVSYWNAIVSTLDWQSSSAGIGFAPDTLQHLRITYGRTGLVYHYFKVAQDYDLNQWYHTMLTYDGTTIKTYFNNQEIDSRDLAIPKGSGSRIGRWADHDSAYFTGSINDVWIHNRALTESERTYLYESYRPKVII
jgi:hypothetical protein